MPLQLSNSGVSVAYIYKALARRRRTGDSGPSPNRGHRPRKLTPELERALAARIGEEPDITRVRSAPANSTVLDGRPSR